jgi:MFS family permease
MLLVDITIVNVALPDIERSLGTSFTELQWVIDAYGLALATIMLNAGALADRIGRRKVFLAGLAIFTRASLVCGFAGSPLFLIAARGVQGIGGAIMFAPRRRWSRRATRAATAASRSASGARRRAANAAFVSGLDRIFWIAAAFAGAVLAAVLVRSDDIEQDDAPERAEAGEPVEAAS